MKGVNYLRNIGLIWTLLCDRDGKTVGLVVTKGAAVFYVVKDENGYSAYNTKYVKVEFSKTLQGTLKSLFKDCSLTYFKIAEGAAFSGIDIAVTGGTYTALSRKVMYYKGTRPILDSISLVNIKSYVTTRVSNTEYVVLSLVPDKTIVYSVKAEIQGIVDIAEDRRGKYINIVFRDNVMECRQKKAGNSAFGSGFIPLDVLQEIQMLNKSIDNVIAIEQARVQSVVARPENIVMQRNKNLYDRLKSEKGISYYASQFTKQCVVAKNNGKLIDRHLEARLRMLIYYGQFGKDRASVAVMDILLGTPSQFKNAEFCGANWSKAIQDSLYLAAGFSPEDGGTCKTNKKYVNTFLFYCMCFKYLMTLYNGFTGEMAESGVFKHYLLGYLCSSDVMSVFLKYKDVKAKVAEVECKKALHKIVTAFVLNLKIDCTDFWGDLSFKSLFEDNRLENKKHTPFENCETVQQVIAILVDRLYSNLIILREKYCTEILTTFAKVSKLYGVNEVSSIINAFKADYKADLVLFEVCKYLRYQFLNPAIPTAAKMPYLQPLYVNKLNKELIMPVYSITRSYVVYCTEVEAQRYVSVGKGKNKWLHIMSANVFSPSEDGKSVRALPHIRTLYTTRHCYRSSLLNSSDVLKRIAVKYKDNRSIGLLLLFVNYAYNKFDVL